MAGQTVVVSVLADTKKFSRSMKNLSQETGLSKLGTAFKNAGSKVANFFKTGIKFAGAFLAAMVGLALKGGFERMLKIEDATAKLRGLGHSAEVVDEVMANALAAVKGTAFGLDSAATAAASAIAAGIKPGQALTEYLALMADTATIAGTSLEEVGSIFNKVMTSGRAQTTELNQIADRGIPIWTALAENYGVTADELRKMVSRGEVDAETFAAVMEDLVGGAAQEAGNTTRGAFNNMLAALSRTGEAMLNEVFPMFKDAFQGITGWLDGLTDKVKPVGEAFGKWLRDTIAKVTPHVKLLYFWFKDYLWPALQDAGKIIGGAFLDAWREITGALKDAGKESGITASGIRVGILAAIRTAAPIIASIVTALGKFVAWLIGARDILIPLGVAIGTIVGAIVTFNKVMAIARAVQAAFNAVMLLNPIVLITVLIAGLVAGLIYFFTQTETGRKIVSGAWKAIQDQMARIVSWFTGSALPTFRKVWSAITGFFVGAATKAKNTWTSVNTFFRQLPARIKAVFAGAVSWLWNGGKNILLGLRNGAVAMWNAVLGWIRDRRTAVTNVFASAGSWLWNAGINIINGFINGINAKFQSVRNTLSRLTNLLPSWKGPADKDRTLLTDAGQLVIEGFIRGLESKYSKVKASLRGLTRDVASTDMGTIGPPEFARPTLSVAGAGAGAGSGPTTINVYALMDGPEVGRRVKNALDDWARVNGGAR